MKNIKILLAAIVLLLITGCGSKVPFNAQEPLENASLVYVYVSSYIGTGETTVDPAYKIRINNKEFKGRIKGGEYVALNLKPNTMTISVTRESIEEKTIKFQPEAGKTYYFRVRNNLENNQFEFIQVENSFASKEISETGLAGSHMISKENMLTELIEPQIVQEVAAPVQQNLSKSDELQKAYNLKEKGILSEEEYKALKKEILTK